MGYRNNPTVEITTGDATTDATLSTTLDEKTGRLTAITIDNVGENYTSVPTVTIKGGAGTGATISVDITSIAGTITAAGSGYADGTYAGVELRNPPTTTFVVTVVQRDKLVVSGGNGTSYTDGETVTGSVSGATGTVTRSGTSDDGTVEFIYITTTSGTWQDSQTDTITGGTSGATRVLDIVTTGVNRYVIDGAEAPSLNLLDNNTYKFDTSDASNAVSYTHLTLPTN